MYLVYDAWTKAFQTLQKEGDGWIMRPSGREALWAPVVNSKEELEGMGAHLPPGFPVARGTYRRVGLAVEAEGKAGEYFPGYMFFERVTEGYPHYAFLEYAAPDWAQWMRAWALARSHGHAWGVFLRKEELEAALAVSETSRELEVRIRSALEWEAGPLGGIFPKGVVRGGKYILPHLTTTGRVYWEVHPGGGLEVEVHRPGLHPVQGGVDGSVTVLRARYRGQWEIITLGPKALPRHVDALLKVAEGASAPMPDEMVAQLQGATLRNEEAQARVNLSVIRERFGSLAMERLRQLIARGAVLFEGEAHTPPSATEELGRDIVAALEAAYRDTPLIASLLIGEG
jgi:hypothetical protein